MNSAGPNMALDIYIDLDASVEALPRQGTVLSGVPAMKGLEDLERHRTVVEATRPDLIIQTGTAVGGSALWFANGGPDVITIDINPLWISPRVLQSKKITVLTGSSTDEVIFNTVRSLAAKYDKTMVVLDSDHSGPHVRREIELYGPLVTPGCYLVVEDGICDFAPDGPFKFKPGPFDAITSCLVGNPDWIRDVDIEAMHPVSMYPAGWWRRA
jgi:cephalosporin hydroxylase